MPEKPEELTVTVTAYAAFAEPLSMHDDLFTVTTSDNTITVTNNSGAAAAQVYVYYKMSAAICCLAASRTARASKISRQARARAAIPATFTKVRVRCCL